MFIILKININTENKKCVNSRKKNGPTHKFFSFLSEKEILFAYLFLKNK